VVALDVMGCRLVQLFHQVKPEMRFCKISKVTSLLYFGLDVFCQFEVRVPEFGAVFRVQCTLCSPQLLGGMGCASKSGL
jgi:hypothetical protein